MRAKRTKILMTMKWKNRLLTGLICVLGAATTTRATDTLKLEEKSPRIETFILLQLWSSYTTNERVFDKDTRQYLPVDDRFNFWLRRGIVGFKAQPYPSLSFKMMTAFDGIGKDLFSGANGSVNNGSLPSISILEAYGQWQVWPGHETFHLTAGYFRPPIGRESFTSSWGVTSMDRAFSSTYLRRHVTGSVFGRTAGLQLGGLAPNPDQDMGFEYAVGVFNPQFAGSGGGSSAAYSPLVAARAAIYFGDPEMKSYQVFRNVNFLSKRRGLTLAANAAWQGPSDLFHSSATLSADLLFNWGPLNVDGEWSYLQREGERALPDDQFSMFTSSAHAGHVRLSYNLNVGPRYVVEPSLTYMFYEGALDREGQADVLAIGALSGSDRGVDFGLNWYIQERKCKLLLHYNWRWGDAGDAGEGSTVNYYYSQSGIGAIQRGNWLGLGVNLMF